MAKTHTQLGPQVYPPSSLLPYRVATPEEMGFAYSDIPLQTYISSNKSRIKIKAEKKNEIRRCWQGFQVLSFTRIEKSTISISFSYDRNQTGQSKQKQNDKKTVSFKWWDFDVIYDFSRVSITPSACLSRTNLDFSIGLVKMSANWESVWT